MPMVGDTLHLPEIEINAINKYEPQTFGGGGGNDSDFSNTPIGQMIDAAKRGYIVKKYPPLIAQDVKSQEEKFSSKLQAMPDSIAQSIYSMNQSNGSSSALEQIENHIRSVDTLIAKKTQEYGIQKAIGDKYYYGRDFFSHTTSYFITLSLSSARANYPPEKNYAEWHASLEGAYTAKYIMREIEYLGALKQQLQRDASQARADAEAKRIADEAAATEAARIAAEQAEQTRVAEAIRVANTFRVPGSASATGPVVITAAGTIGVIEAAAVTLQAAIRSAIAALTNLLAGTASGLLVGVSALVYSPKLANGELPERYTFNTPLSDLDPEQNQDLLAIAATGGTVNLPVRLNSKTAVDGQSEVIVVKTDGATIPSSVRVVAATYDAAQNVYSVTTGDTPPRTLTWTPIVNPGNSSTTSPAEPPAPPVYTGATVTPVEGRIDTFPGAADAGFDDFITVFPADSGLPPIYVMFRDRREDPGVATGVGQPVSGIWLGAASQGEGAPIPAQIADQLRGKEFKSFREFREAFWKAVANDPELSKQFNLGSLAVMKDGSAAYVRELEQVGGRVKFEIHHKNRIIDGGGVYDIDNLVVVTPKRHIKIHNGGK